MEMSHRDAIDSLLRKWRLSYLYSVKPRKETTEESIYDITFSQPTQTEPIPRAVHTRFTVAAGSDAKQPVQVSFRIESSLHTYHVSAGAVLTDELVTRHLRSKLSVQGAA